MRPVGVPAPRASSSMHEHFMKLEKGPPSRKISNTCIVYLKRYMQQSRNLKRCRQQHTESIVGKKSAFIGGEETHLSDREKHPL